MFKRVSSIQPWLKMGCNSKWRWSATWLSIVCNNLLSRVPGIRRRKPSNLLLYRKLCEVWGKNPPNMKCFNRLVDAFDLLLLSVVVYQKVLTTGHAIFTDVVHCTRNVPCIFAVWEQVFQNWCFKNRLLLECSVYCLVSLCVEIDNVCFAEHPTQRLGRNFFIRW